MSSKAATPQKSTSSKPATGSKTPSSARNGTGKPPLPPPKTGGAEDAKAAANKAEELQAEIVKLNEELNTERSERNYFQLERDKVMSFWEISKNDLKEARAELLNKDRELEELEEKHQVEIKVYKQKVKHLLYEYQNNVAHLQADSERALQLDQEEHLLREEQLKKDKRALRLELKELELAHEDIIKNITSRHDQECTRLRADYERRARELHQQYDKKMKMMRDELELKRKNEIHEIEERKNGQINALMKNHEKAFTEIKNYYNDITLNNLALINSLKEQVEEMKKKEERNEKLMADITSENKRLSEPLQEALAECDQLKKELQHYEKDKLSLKNAKARLRVLEEKHKELLWEHELLEQRYVQMEKERNELFENFVDKIIGVQQKAGFKNLILEKKMETLKATLEKKDLQLNEVLKATHLDPAALSNLTKRLEETMEGKNRQIKDLQYDLAKITKAYNDMIRVYEAKLTEFNIPLEEIGFKPLVPKAKGVNANPAGLVAAEVAGLDLRVARCVKNCCGTTADEGFGVVDICLSLCKAIDDKATSLSEEILPPGPTAIDPLEQLIPSPSSVLALSSSTNDEDVTGLSSPTSSVEEIRETTIFEDGSNIAKDTSPTLEILSSSTIFDGETINSEAITTEMGTLTEVSTIAQGTPHIETSTFAEESSITELSTIAQENVVTTATTIDQGTTTEAHENVVTTATTVAHESTTTEASTTVEASTETETSNTAETSVILGSSSVYEETSITTATTETTAQVPSTTTTASLDFTYMQQHPSTTSITENSTIPSTPSIPLSTPSPPSPPSVPPSPSEAPSISATVDAATSTDIPSTIPSTPPPLPLVSAAPPPLVISEFHSEETHGDASVSSLPIAAGAEETTSATLDAADGMGRSETIGAQPTPFAFLDALRDAPVFSVVVSDLLIAAGAEETTLETGTADGMANSETVGAPPFPTNVASVVGAVMTGPPVAVSVEEETFGTPSSVDGIETIGVPPLPSNVVDTPRDVPPIAEETALGTPGTANGIVISETIEAPPPPRDASPIDPIIAPSAEEITWETPGTADGIGGNETINTPSPSNVAEVVTEPANRAEGATLGPPGNADEVEERTRTEPPSAPVADMPTRALEGNLEERPNSKESTHPQPAILAEGSPPISWEQINPQRSPEAHDRELDSTNRLDAKADTPAPVQPPNTAEALERVKSETMSFNLNVTVTDTEDRMDEIGQPTQLNAARRR
ncbi:Dynein regulatory complex subunit 4 [Phlyctochytrium bullatum]|nr:Dynein regulatory complex subunit 4 [Phlyctochytrium bullatum]